MTEVSRPTVPRRSDLLGARADLVYASVARVLGLPGDIAECGSNDGVTAVNMARIAAGQGVDKTVHAFDTFDGFPDVITDEEKSASEWPELGPGLYPAAPTAVEWMQAQAPNIAVHRGLFSETFPAFDRPLCFIHSDSDLYISTVETIELAVRTLVPGGVILFDDYGNPRLPGVQMAVDRCLDPGLFDGYRVQDAIQFTARRR